jgi:hypothetical protein
VVSAKALAEALAEKKLSDVPDTVEHHARQVSGERESAGGEP